MALSFGDVVVLSSVVWVILGFVLSVFLFALSLLFFSRAVESSRVWGQHD